MSKGITEPDILQSLGVAIVEARQKADSMERAGAEQARRADENLEALKAAKQRELELLAVNAQITSAAQAVIDRWETPLWKDVKPTGVFIYALRDAIKIEPSQALREHEAKVLGDVAEHFKVFGHTDTALSNELRHMAEERRKK